MSEVLTILNEVKKASGGARQSNHERLARLSQAYENILRVLQEKRGGKSAELKELLNQRLKETRDYVLSGKDTANYSVETLSKYERELPQIRQDMKRMVSSEEIESILNPKKSSKSKKEGGEDV